MKKGNEQEERHIRKKGKERSHQHMEGITVSLFFLFCSDGTK
jgi:hypothetical protein